MTTAAIGHVEKRLCFSEVDNRVLTIGALQLFLLGQMWRHNSMSFAHIMRVARREYREDVAASTVSTTLIRMVEQGYLFRPKFGYYTASISREELIAQIADRIWEV